MGDEIGRTEERRRLMEQGLELWQARRAREAVEVYERCLLLFDEADRGTEEYALFCNNYASAAVAIGQLKQAETMFLAAYAIFEQNDGYEDMARVDFNLGNVYRGMQVIDRSSDHYRAALEAYEDLGDERGASLCLASLTLNYLAVGSFEKARASLAEIDALSAEVRDDPELQWSCSFQRAKLALHDGRYDDATAAMEASQELAQQLGDPNYIAQSKGAMRNILQRIEAAKRLSAEPPARPERTSVSDPEGSLLPPLAPGQLEPIETAAAQSGVRMIVLALGDQAWVVTTDGAPGAMSIDAGAVDLLAQLDLHGKITDSRFALQWSGHAQKAVRLGIEWRARGDLPHAYVHQRFAFFVALRQGTVPGVTAIAANMWVLRESIRDVTERAKGPARDAKRPGFEKDVGERLRKTLAFMRHDARLAEATVRELARASAQDTASRMALHHACHRLARMAGNEQWRAAELEALLELAGEGSAPDVPLTVAAEEVAQMDLADVLSAGGALSAEARPASRAAEAWPRYREWRARIEEVRDLATVLQACNFAFEHLCYLRLRATTGGGAFGHELSYAISSLVQVVGRDLVGLLQRANHGETALYVVEKLLARSMADWMARTHGGWAIPPEFLAIVSGLTGSLNAVAVAGLEDIRAATRTADAPLLYYLRQRDDFLAWLVRKDGRVVTAEVENPAPLLAHLLPSIASEAREELGPDEARAEEEEIERGLRALYDTLIPALIREALADQGERLVIVPDPSIQSVPFCALRTPQDRFLIEEHELVFWPSVTACLNLEAGAQVSPADRARVEHKQPLVIGIRTFDREYSIPGLDGDVSVDFDDLPQAVKEAEHVAEILGTTAVLDDDATLEALLNGGRGADIVHIATHGYLIEAQPRQSFLALADGKVTANALYRQDRGLQTGLVVLSACETALGGGHADSVIGLANAFLIAGASSVVSTLWPIADDATPVFMSAFYGAIQEGQDLAASLRHAQRVLLENPATRDPFFWAPFVMTGRTANPLAGES